MAAVEFLQNSDLRDARRSSRQDPRRPPQPAPSNDAPPHSLFASVADERAFISRLARGMSGTEMSAWRAAAGLPQPAANRARMDGSVSPVDTCR